MCIESCLMDDLLLKQPARDADCGKFLAVIVHLDRISIVVVDFPLNNVLVYFAPLNTPCFYCIAVI